MLSLDARRVVPQIPAAGWGAEAPDRSVAPEAEEAMTPRLHRLQAAVHETLTALIGYVETHYPAVYADWPSALHLPRPAPVDLAEYRRLRDAYGAAQRELDAYLDLLG